MFELVNDPVFLKFLHSLNTELNKGYFSSNRNGNDAIFEVF